MGYIDDLIIYSKESQHVPEFALRNIEVYVRDYVKISSDRLGYPNDIKHVKQQIKNDLRKVISKYI